MWWRCSTAAAATGKGTRPDAVGLVLVIRVWDHQVIALCLRCSLVLCSSGVQGKDLSCKSHNALCCPMCHGIDAKDLRVELWMLPLTICSSTISKLIAKQLMAKWLLDGSYVLGAHVIYLVRTKMFSMAFNALPSWLHKCRSPYACMLIFMQDGGGRGVVDDGDCCLIVPDQRHRPSNSGENAGTRTCCYSLSTGCCLGQSSPNRTNA